MLLRFNAIWVFVLAVAILRPAHAQTQDEAQDAQTENNMALDLHTSLGGPQGYAGATWTGTFEEQFALTLGGGIGFTGYGGSIAPRITLVHGSNYALGVGLGASVFTMDFVDEPLIADFSSESIHFKADAVLWLHAEGTLTYQDESGVRVGGYVGVTSVVAAKNPRSRLVDSVTGGDIAFSEVRANELPYHGEFVPYAGVFIGHAF